MGKFSVVIPVKGTSDEVKVMPRTLPSYYAVKPHELIISIDNPPEDERIIPLIEEIAENHNTTEITKIVKVKVGGEGWGDQQMKARYTGISNATFNRVLTGDIDLIINRNVYKALKLVGKNNVGLASCSKFRIPHDFLSFYRLFSDSFIKTVIHHFKKTFGATTFTGLYAFWKSFWEDVMPIEKAKSFVKFKAKVRKGESVNISDFFCKGDDTFLKDLMIEKYKCIYLEDIGGLVLTDPWENRPIVQYGKGVYFANQGRGLVVSLARALMRGQPYYFCGYLHGRKIKDISGFQFAWTHKIKGGA